MNDKRRIIARAAGLLLYGLILLSGQLFAQLATVLDLQQSVQDVYQNSADSVVNITTTSIVANRFNRTVSQEGSGSGFIWDTNGHIVTNYHVVENAQTVMVSFGEDEFFKAEVIGADPGTDLAVLKIRTWGARLEPLELADSDSLIVGQFVAAIGNPFGFNRTLTFGVISALGRVIQNSNDQFISEAIQTDTPINPGNSGGPLLDLDGKVIGVNSAIISPSGVSAGIGFAISSNVVSEVIPVLIREGSYPHPWLGITSVNLNVGVIELLAQADIKIPVDAGLLLLGVAADGPADNAGLQGSTSSVRYSRMRSIPVGGDIIVAVNGRPIDALKDLTLFLEKNIQIGESVRITYYRNGRRRNVNVMVGELPGV
ncbi:MAG: trypsin-like serine protease [Spirochaetales bacterium]|jgi:S1-C subfamily serine protease|nr:trypsin-like serine protease [Spirochaetales bacterium]